MMVLTVAIKDEEGCVSRLVMDLSVPVRRTTSAQATVLLRLLKGMYASLLFTLVMGLMVAINILEVSV
jgi:hypothetical protein